MIKNRKQIVRYEFTANLDNDFGGWVRYDAHAARIAELEAALRLADERLAHWHDEYHKALAENANLHEQINTLDAKIDQALEWNGQAMVRAELYEDLNDRQAAKIKRLTSRGIEDMKFEIGTLKSENARLREELGNALASMANCPMCADIRYGPTLNTEQGDD